MTARTFELTGTTTRAVGETATLAQASADLPSGAYTSLRTYAGNRVLRLEQHVRRLEESVALQGRPAPLDPAAVGGAIAAALGAAGHRESRVRLTFAPPRFFVSVEPFEQLPEALYLEGASCVTLALRRENPHAKDTRFIATASGAYGRLPDGVHEGLLVAADDSLLEGLSSNFFAVRSGVLHTEEERVLLGVTRALVLEVAQGIMPVDRTAVRWGRLPELSEAFITSVSRAVLPVVRIDGQVIGHGRPGPKTRAIMQAFADLVRREAKPL
jgi:branched-subunit amino acid aminotransferase/4-amino-4-deoxychorismate lyase